MRRKCLVMGVFAIIMWSRCMKTAGQKLVFLTDWRVEAFRPDFPSELTSKTQPGLGLSFDCDLNIADGTEVQPGTELLKGWRLQNQTGEDVPSHFFYLNELVSYGPVIVPEKIWVPEVPKRGKIDVYAIITVKQDAPEGQCFVQFNGANTVDKPNGIHCMIELKKEMPASP